MNIKQPYRLKIVTFIRVLSQAQPVPSGATYFIRYENGSTNYISGDETPLALSNLLGEHAAETRFTLEEVVNGEQAQMALRMAIQKVFRGAAELTPTVEVL